jgi:hypothetical protein
MASSPGVQPPVAPQMAACAVCGSSVESLSLVTVPVVSTKSLIPF